MRLLLICCNTVLFCLFAIDIQSFSNDPTYVSNIASDDFRSNFDPFAVIKELGISPKKSVSTSVSKSMMSSSLTAVSNYATRAYPIPGPHKPWISQGSAQGAPDGVGARVVAFNTNDLSNPLWVYEYGFDIPCNAVIDSVTVKLVRRNTMAPTDVVDTEIALWMPNMTISSMNLASPDPWFESATDWDTVTYTHENWGETLTPAIVNDPKFGAYIAAENTGASDAGAQLDAARMIVCYTVATPYTEPISATFAKTDACENDGTITVNATGGSGTYEYSINNGMNWQPSNLFSGLTGGDYIIFIRNSDQTCQTTPLYCSLNSDSRIIEPGDGLIACRPQGNNITLAIEKIQPFYDFYQQGLLGVDVSEYIPAHPYEWSTSQLGGEVFSVTTDQDLNIYTGTTVLYNILGSTTPRITSINAYTGVATILSTLPGNRGIGGIEYDTVCNQLFVTNLDDGMLYRLDPTNGATLSTFDPMGADPGGNGLAPLGERTFAVTYNYADSRLYYSVWNSDFNTTGIRNTIRSVAIDPVTCDFLPLTDQLEISLPWTSEYGNLTETTDYSMPVSDIEISDDGATFLLAETGYDSDNLIVKPHLSRLLTYTGSTSSWTLNTTIPAGNTYLTHELGEIGTGMNSRGGVDFAYQGFSGLCTNDNELWIATTADAIRGTTCYAFGCIYGIQYMPISGGNAQNSVVLDIARMPGSQQKSVFGDFDVIQGCRSNAACCPDITIDTAPISECVGTTLTTIDVTTVSPGVSLVYFTSPQTDTSIIYSSGTVLDSAIPSGGTASLSLASLPNGTATTYYLYVIADPVPSDPSCRPADGITLTLTALPVSTATSNGPVCSGEDVTFNETGMDATGWVWTGPSGFNETAQSPGIVGATSANAGDYTVVVTDASGCTSSSTVTLVVNELPTCSTTTTPATCGMTNGSITVTGSGGLPPLEYSIDGTNFQSSNVFNGQAGGMYTVTVMDANGCSTTCVADIDVPGGPTCSLAQTDILCNGDLTGDITVTATGTGTLEYSIDGTNFGTSPSFTMLAAGPYVITVRDGNGCTTTCTTTLTEPNALTCSLAKTDETCTLSDGTITVTASGGQGNLEYSTDGTNFFPSNVFSGLAPATYTVTVRDENLCTTTCTIDVLADCYDLAITKAVLSTGPYAQGSNVQFELTIANEGTLDASGITFIDIPDAGLNYIGSDAGSNPNISEVSSTQFTIGSLAANTTETLILNYEIDANFQGSSLINNTEITVDDGDDDDSDPSTSRDIDEDGDGNGDDDDEDQQTITIGQAYDLALSKAITSMGPYGPDSTVTFSITVVNEASLNASDIVITENSDPNLNYVSMDADPNLVDNGNETFTIASLPAGQTEVINLTYNIDANFMGTTLINNVQITVDDGDDIDSDPNTDYLVDENGDLDPFDDDEDTVNLNVDQVYDLSLTKAVTNTPPYAQDSVVTFSITVVNEGTLNASNVVVTENSDPGLTFVSMTPDANVADNGNETFTITSLNAGNTQVINLTYQVNASFMGTSIFNNAQITVDDGDDVDSDPDQDYLVDEDGDLDPDDDDEDGLTIPIDQIYDLALTKTMTSTGPYVSGSTVNFTLTLTNEGTLDAAGIVVSEISDANLNYISMVADANVTDNGDETFTVANLSAMQQQVILLTYEVDADYMGTSLTNDVQITLDDGDDIDSDPATDNTIDEDGDLDPDDDDEDGLLIPVDQTYDLSLAKVITSAGPYGSDSTVVFTLTITNEGSLDATGVVVTDNSDAELLYQLMTPDVNVVDNGNETFTIASLPRGNSQDIILTYRIASTFMGNSLDNAAQITVDDGDDVDSDPDQDYLVDEDGDLNPDDDDEDIVTVNIGQIYDLTLTKTETSMGPYSPGSIVSFTITVANEGTLDASGVVVTDNSPLDLIYQSMTPDANVTDNLNETFTITSLPANQQQDIVLSYMIGNNFMGLDLLNQAQITVDDGDDIDSDPDQDYLVDEDGDTFPDDDDEDEAAIVVDQIYDLSLSKIITSTGPYGPGSIVVFELDLVNEGTLDGTNIVVTEDPQAGLNFQSMTPAVGVTDNGDGTFTIASLPINTNQTIELTYQIDAAFMGVSLINQSQITVDDGDDADSDPDTDYTTDEDGDGNPFDDDEDEVSIPIGQIYDLSLTKVISNAGPFAADSTVVFTITVTNEGSLNANNVVVTESSDPNLTYISMAADANLIDNGNETFTIASIPSGTQQEIVLTYNIDPAFMGTSLVNGAQITVDDGDDVDSDPDLDETTDEDGDGDPFDDDEDEVTVTVGQAYDLSLTKSITSVGPYIPGSNVTFSLTITNEGSLDASNVVIMDDSPADLVYQNMTLDPNVTDNGDGTFTIASLPSTNQQMIELNYQISTGFMGSAIDNNAQIIADDGDDIDSDPDQDYTTDEDGDGNPDDDDEDGATINIGQVYDLSLTKTMTSVGPFAQDSAVTFVLTLANEGTLNAANIVVTELSPAGLVFQSMTPDANVVDNGDETFTVATLPVGTQQDIVLNYNVASDFMGTSLLNVAMITTDDGDDIDSDPDQDITTDEDGDGDPYDDDEDDANVPIGQIYDLSLTKAITTPGPFGPDDNVTFTLTVTNQGSLDATNIVVTENSDASLEYVSMIIDGNVTDNGDETFTITSLPANTQQDIVLNYHIAADFMGTDLPNGAQITTDDGDDVDSDPDLDETTDEDGDGDPDDDDEDNVLVPVGQVYDLSLTKIVTSMGPYEQGSIISYRITVVNEGTLDAAGVLISDLSPTGLTYQSMAPDGNVIDNGDETFTILSLGSAQQQQIDISYQVNNTFMGSVISNGAEISSDDGDDIDSDPDTGDDIDEDGDGDPDDDDEDRIDVPVDQVYDLSITKVLTSAGPYNPGSTLTFDIAVINEGTLDASNIVVTEHSSTGMTYVGITANANIVDNGDETFTILNIPSLGTEVIQLSYTIDANYMGTSLRNDAEITADDGDDTDSDPDTGNDVDEDGDGDPDDDDEDGMDIPVDQIYDLALINRVVSEEPFYEGKDVTFEIIVYNQGTIDANNIEIVDYVPAGLTLETSDNPGWSGALSNDGTSTLHTTTIPFIAAGGQASVLVTLRVNSFALVGTIESNWAEISNDDGDDVDSTPDNINSDPFGGDDIIDNSNADEDDHDSAELLIEAGLATIGDRVWEDVNGNGIYDSGEQGIEDVVVKIYNIIDELVNITRTDVDGYYLFENLPPGGYYLEFIVEDEEYEVALTNQGDNTENDSNIDNSNGPFTTPITILSPGEIDLSWDAALHKCTQIGQLVWYDRNMNDQYEEGEENGVNGLIVNLYRLVNGTYVWWAQDITGINKETGSDDGYFKFCAPPGTYYIEYLIPKQGLVTVVPFVGPTDTDSDLNDENGKNTTPSFSVIQGQSKCDIGLGLYPMATIGDIVWFDNNANGIREQTENIAPGVVVEAYDIYNDMVGEGVTNDEGKYMIDYLKKDDYYLKFYPPDGYSFTYYVGANDETNDSDVNHQNGENTTSFYSMSPGEHVANIDAGLVVGAALPVKLNKFAASYRPDYIYLNWESSSEINTDYYIIEKRFESEEVFVSIGRQAAQGQSSKYNMNDYDIENDGVYYYRLKMIDKDGSEELSDVISVDIGRERNGGVSIYPNPAVSEVNLEISLSQPSSINVNIFDSAGQLIRENVAKGNYQKGHHKILLNIDGLANGVYNVQVEKEGESYFKKLILLRN